MFTGLIQEIGRIERLQRRGATAVLTIESSFENVELGESIAVMGACLSVTGYERGQFSAFASSETLEKTKLGSLRAGSHVNLERALKTGDRIGGHLVSGHVDDCVALLARTPLGEAERLTIALPTGPLAKQIAPKGSVALDGVSLTVNDVHRDRFEVVIIPLTLGDTTLGALAPRDYLNIETDVLAKYVARQFDRDESGKGVDIALLERSGFMR